MSRESQVICVPSAMVKGHGLGQGFIPISYPGAQNFLSDALSVADRDGAVFERPEIENDEKYKQLVTYGIIEQNWRRIQRVYFLYQRKPSGGENRLYGKWSIGVGGHIESGDWLRGANLYHSAMHRELSEEVTFHDAYSFGITGLINDDSDPVGRVHLGIVYHIMTFGFVSPGSDGIGEYRFEGPDRLAQFAAEHDCENWTKLIISQYFRPDSPAAQSRPDMGAPGLARMP